jgi:DNA-binding NarL/FixJ family response regulator
MTLRIVVAEDNFLMREGIVEVLNEEDDVEVVAVVGDYDALLRAVEREGPDVVLSDIRMPPTETDEGVRMAEYLTETHPKIGIVLISQYVDAHFALRLLQNGSARRAYLLKERVGHRVELMDAITEVARGGSRVDAKVVESLVEQRKRAANSPLDSLTTREAQVLSELAQGKSNAAIGQSLFLTKRGIEKHINSIFSKLGLVSEEDVARRVVAALIFLSDDISRREDSFSDGVPHAYVPRIARAERDVG